MQSMVQLTVVSQKSIFSKSIHNLHYVPRYKCSAYQRPRVVVRSIASVGEELSTRPLSAQSNVGSPAESRSRCRSELSGRFVVAIAGERQGIFSASGSFGSAACHIVN